MSENLRNYTKALFAFDHVVKNAKPTTYKRKSPCEGWTGADVYEHVLGGVKMVQSFAATGTGPRSTPKLGAKPLEAWEKLRDQTLEALDQEGVLQSIAKDPFGPDFGPMSIDALVGFMTADLAVHTWDLARTAKVDERLDPGLVKFANTVWRNLPDPVLRSQGMFGPKVKVEKGADAQTKMLNYLGRTV
ncbi:MAG: TIGR03086 family metal-binding protein [Acidimicrobiia bacterium]|nr:TIGR03086 family metal-binding protein [Acidimicrobiia bacterium]